MLVGVTGNTGQFSCRFGADHLGGLASKPNETSCGWQCSCRFGADQLGGLASKQNETSCGFLSVCYGQEWAVFDAGFAITDGMAHDMLSLDGDAFQERFFRRKNEGRKEEGRRKQDG